MTSDAPKQPRRLPRFSLRTLILFVALAGSGFGLWAHWEPWVVRPLTFNLVGMTPLDLRTYQEEDSHWLTGTEFSTDGARALTAFRERAILWDTATGAPLRDLWDVRAWGWSTEGARLITVGNYFSREIDGQTGKTLRLGMTDLVGIRSVQFLEGSRRLAVYIGDWGVVFDGETGAPVRELPLFSKSVSPNGNHVLAWTQEPQGSYDDSYGNLNDAPHVVALASGKTIANLEVDPPYRWTDLLPSIRWTGDSRFLVGQFRMDSPVIWDAATGRLVHPRGRARDRYKTKPNDPPDDTMSTYEGHVVPSPGGAVMAVIQYEEENEEYMYVSIWDAARQEISARWHPFDAEIWLARPPAEWTAQERTHHLETETLSSDPALVAFAPDARHLFTIENDRLCSRDLRTGRRTRVFGTNDTPVFTAIISPDGARLLSVDQARPVKGLEPPRTQLRLWDASSGRLLRSRDVAWAANSAVFSPDGRRIALVMGREQRQFYGLDEILVIDAESLETVRRFKGTREQPIRSDGAPVNTIIEVDAGRMVVQWSKGATTVWEPITRRKFGQTFFQNSSKYIGDHDRTVTLLPGGERLIGLHKNGDIQVLRMHDLQPHLMLEGHDSPCLAFAVSGDGRRILTLSQTRTNHSSARPSMTARLFDASSGRLFASWVIEETISPVLSLSQRGDHVLLIDSALDTVRVFDTQNGELLAELPGDWAQYAAASTRIVTTTINDVGDVVRNQIWDAQTFAPMAVPAPQGYAQNDILNLSFSRDGRHLFLSTRDGLLWRGERIRPEQWYGVFHLKEFWLTLTLTLTLLWSLRRDWKSLPAGQLPGDSPSAVGHDSSFRFSPSSSL